jgi:hypothetical protein
VVEVDRAQQRFDALGREEADVGVGLFDAWELDLARRVGQDPLALLGVGEQAVQDAEPVAHALGRAPLGALGHHEALDVGGGDLGDRAVVEERDEVDADG